MTYKTIVDRVKNFISRSLIEIFLIFAEPNSEADILVIIKRIECSIHVGTIKTLITTPTTIKIYLQKYTLHIRNIYSI